MALLDGNVMPAQFTDDRVRSPDVQALRTKVSARPNASYTAQYPHRMPAKITLRLTDGTTLEHEVQDYPGMPSHPFTWNDVVEKFDRLTADRLDSDLANQIKDAVHSLEHIKVRDLMALLTRIPIEE